MKVNLLPNLFPRLRLRQSQSHQYSSGALASLFSAKPKTQLPSSKTPIASSSNSTLCGRIQLIRDPKTSVVPVLEQWVSEGKTVGKRQLQYLVRTMKNYKRFHHALEISYWMTNRHYIELSSSDVALRLDLIHRVYGIEPAENYFSNVSDNFKTHNVYGALLSCYVQAKYVEKAEATMQKMRELGLATSSFPYNMMITLYIETGDFNKIETLIQEMAENGIPQDKYTIRNQMAAYSAASDISGMERVLSVAEKNVLFVFDWKIYSVAANGYLKAGLTDKALQMLKKLEAMMPYQRTNLAIEFLITLYASTGKKDDLYRIWKMYKPSDKQIATPYAVMITSLTKLDDFEGAEKVFEEWESQCTIYDFRVLNRLLVAYCKKGLLEKAESAVNKAVVGRRPYASTWNILATGYKEHNQMSKAVEMLKRAISVGRLGWWPNSVILDACLDYLEGQRDLSEIKDTIGLLKNLCPLTRDIYHRWLRTCVAAGGSVSEVLNQMKMDGFSADEETHKILETGPSL